MRLRSRLMVGMTALVVLGFGLNLVLALSLGEALSRDVQTGKLADQVRKDLEILSATGDDQTRAEAGTGMLLQLNRELGMSGFDRQSLVLDLAVPFTLFFVLGTLLILVFGMILGRSISRPLARLVGDIQALPGRPPEWQFPDPGDEDFTALVQALNLQRQQILAREELLAEHARVGGWHEVASYLNHQIRNPLTALNLACANLEILTAKTGQAAPEEPAGESSRLIQDQLHTLKVESLRLNGIIKRFGNATVCPSPSLEPVKVQEIAAGLDRRFVPKGILTRLSGNPEARIMADPRLVHEALSNLFQNSLEASLADGQHKPCTVDFTWEEKPEGVCLTLGDSNTGFPPHLARQVMEKPFTTKPGGSGLGLTFARTVIKLHGGSIKARLNAGGGLVFAITLENPGPSSGEEAP